MFYFGRLNIDLVFYEICQFFILWLSFSCLVYIFMEVSYYFLWGILVFLLPP